MGRPKLKEPMTMLNVYITSEQYAWLEQRSYNLSIKSGVQVSKAAIVRNAMKREINRVNNVPHDDSFILWL